MRGYLTVAIGGHLFLRRKRELACKEVLSLAKLLLYPVKTRRVLNTRWWKQHTGIRIGVRQHTPKK